MALRCGVYAIVLTLFDFPQIAPGVFAYLPQVSSGRYNQCDWRQMAGSGTTPKANLPPQLCMWDREDFYGTSRIVEATPRCARQGGDRTDAASDGGGPEERSPHV